MAATGQSRGGCYAGGKTVYHRSGCSSGASRASLAAVVAGADLGQLVATMPGCCLGIGRAGVALREQHTEEARRLLLGRTACRAVLGRRRWRAAGFDRLGRTGLGAAARHRLWHQGHTDTRVECLGQAVGRHSRTWWSGRWASASAGDTTGTTRASRCRARTRRARDPSASQGWGYLMAMGNGWASATRASASCRERALLALADWISCRLRQAQSASTGATGRRVSRHLQGARAGRRGGSGGACAD